MASKNRRWCATARKTRPDYDPQTLAAREFAADAWYEQHRRGAQREADLPEIVPPLPRRQIRVQRQRRRLAAIRAAQALKQAEREQLLEAEADMIAVLAKLRGFESFVRPDGEIVTASVPAHLRYVLIADTDGPLEEDPIPYWPRIKMYAGSGDMFYDSP